jgi:hypothetical protein
VVKLGKTFSILVAFLLTLSLLAVPALAPPVASAADIADLPNPLTVSFSASGSEGDIYPFTVVPDAVNGTVLNQFSRPWMIVNTTNISARFFNMSTASGSVSGDLSGSLDMVWNRIDFATPYFNSSDWFMGTPTGLGIVYLKGNMTGTILGDLTFIGAADIDYKGTSAKGEGRVMTVENWTKGLTTYPDRVLIGEITYEISGGTITGTLTLRNYSYDPVGLEGRVNTTTEWLALEGQLVNDESDWITNDTVEFMQFTRDPVQPGHRIVLEEMAPGREDDQDITAGAAGVGGTISLLRTGVLDVIAVSGQDIPVYAITGTRTVENNWASNKTSMRGMAKTIVLVEMVDFNITSGVLQQSFTMMPGYSEGYEGTGYYAGFEAYVVPYTHISLTLYLDGDDYRYSLLPTPQITSVSPNVGQGGAEFEVTINGKFFWVNETYHPLTIDFGSGITVVDHTVVSDTEIKATINISTSIGPRNVSVTKRGQTGTLVDGFGVGAALDANVTFVGRATASQWIEPFVVHFINATTDVTVTATTNGTGWFTVTGIQPDTYDVGIKNTSCLSEVVTGQTLVMNQSTVIDFGTPREGDVDNNDLINMLDKGPLANAWNTWPGQPLWNPSCDFNRDGIINMLDKGPIGNNWGQWGELLD